MALACLRLGFPTAYAKGAHLLPADVTDPLVPTLVRSLDADELRRALVASAEAFAREVRQHDAVLAERLRPLFGALLSGPESRTADYPTYPGAHSQCEGRVSPSAIFVL